MHAFQKKLDKLSDVVSNHDYVLSTVPVSPAMSSGASSQQESQQRSMNTDDMSAGTKKKKKEVKCIVKSCMITYSKINIHMSMKRIGQWYHNYYLW